MFMIKKQIPFLVTLCLLLLLNSATFLFSAEKTYTLGGKVGWSSVKNRTNVITSVGRYGQEALSLDTNGEKIQDLTDLLITFEDNNIIGNYTIESSDVELDSRSIRGKKAAMFRDTSSGMKVKGEVGSLFGTEGLMGSFSIRFWINPIITETGERILTWSSSRNLDTYSLYQMIIAEVHNNSIQWTFNNLFEIPGKNNNEYQLNGVTTLIPGVWSYHEICYDEATGLLEYRVNGRVEALSYVTSTGRERGSVYQAVMGVPSPIDIGGGFSGFIDDFSIVRTASFIENPTTSFVLDGGRFETEPLLLSQLGASVSEISVVANTPNESEIEYFIRCAENCFDWTETYPVWKSVAVNEPLSELNGLYFQIAANLYPDGTGEKSPSIISLVVHYKENELPFPPFSVNAKAGNGYVDLEWSSVISSPSESIGGYLVYYGQKPGEYLGTVAVEGISPIDVGKKNSIRINGLINGRIYYFAIASYTDFEPRIIGTFSKEVSARPLQR